MPRVQRVEKSAVNDTLVPRPTKLNAHSNGHNNHEDSDRTQFHPIQTAGPYVGGDGFFGPTPARARPGQNSRPSPRTDPMVLGLPPTRFPAVRVIGSRSVGPARCRGRGPRAR